MKNRFTQIIAVMMTAVCFYAILNGFKKAEDYTPTLASLHKHQSPEWYDDAKFGMFIDYGLYSIAGWAPPKEIGKAMYPDWYLNNMYKDSSFIKHHQEVWGRNFERDDFIPLFKATGYDPEKLAELAREAGMKYVIPFAKHHDGFCLWPSKFTKRNSFDMSPGRDLIKPMVASCKARGLKFGFYFSVEEWEYPIIDKSGALETRLWDAKGPMFIPYDKGVMTKRASGKIPVKDFFSDYIIPQAKEFIDLYEPDLIWFDGEWTTPIEDTKTPEIVSYYYNKFLNSKKVLVNDRWGMDTRFKVGDFFTSEYHSLDLNAGGAFHKWEETRGLSQSFGFNRDDNDKNIMSSSGLITMLCDIVSKGGNLLLVVNLDGQGKVPAIQEKRLKDVGKWLKINGEAIYNTRPWLRFAEGNMDFTQSKDGNTIYVICKYWPKESLGIESIFLQKSAKITLLGTDEQLNWSYEYKYGTSKKSKVNIIVPEKIRPANVDGAYVFKIQI